MRKSKRIIAILVVVTILTLSFVAQSSSINPSGSSTPNKYLGFWIQESDPIHDYTPTQFFDQYFLRPPYPSALEVMIFSTIGAGASLNASINYWSQVASLADQYPNIEITPMLAFGTTSGAPSLENWPNVQQWINGMKGQSSIYSFGIEGEFSTQLAASDIPTVASYILNTGKHFVNYYLHDNTLLGNKYTVMGQSGGFQIGQTNFPDYYAGQADQVGTLNLFADQYSDGISAGVYFSAQFPGSVVCPIGTSNITSSNYGYNQCVIDTVISSSLSFSSSLRQFVNIDAGLSYPQFTTFIDSAGIKTSEMWDNPTLRSWISADQSYSPNFVLSTDTSTLGTSSTLQTLTSTSLTTSSSISSNLSTSQTSTSFSSSLATSTLPSLTSATENSSSTNSSSSSSSSTKTSPSATSTYSSTRMSSSSSTITQISTSSSTQSAPISSSSTSTSVTVSQSRSSQSSSAITTTQSSSITSTSNFSGSQLKSSHALAPLNSDTTNSMAVTFGFVGYEIALIGGIPFMSWTIRRGEFEAAKIAKSWRW